MAIELLVAVILVACKVPPKTLKLIELERSALRTSSVPLPVLDNVPVPLITPEKLPEATFKTAELLTAIDPPARLVTEAAPPLSVNEPAVIEVMLPAEMAVANPPLSVPNTKFAALTEPPLRVASCRRPIFALIIPSLMTVLLRVALLAKVVVPEPVRLPKVIVPLSAVNFVTLLLDNVPRVRPLPETSNCPPLTVSKEFCA